MSSSRPVKLTGWNAIVWTLSMFSAGELNDAADAVVVPRIHDRRDERDLDPDRCEILDRLELHIEKISDTAMLVVFLVRSIELQIDSVLSGFFRGLTKFNVLGVTNSVRRRKDAIETDLLRIRDCVQEVRRKRRLAAREIK
jgi:hypothetical protein